MIKTISIASVAAVMVLGLYGLPNAYDDPPGGQSSSQLDSLSPRSGSPSESGKTGIGSTSGSDATIDTGQKSTTQEGKMPCPGKTPESIAERNKGVGIVQGTLGDQERQAKPESKMDAKAPRSSDARSSAEISSRMGSDPCVESPASGSQPDRR